MALIAPTYITANPSFTMPELLLPYSQASGVFDLLPNSDLMQRLGEGDQAVYIKRVDIRTRMASGQSAYNQLPGVDLEFEMGGTPTYLNRVRNDFDHHDIAAAGRWGVGLPEAYRLGSRQSHFQLMRSALLYGYQPQNGEGVLNAPGITTINLPPDSNGNDAIISYDAGQLALFFLQQISQIKSRTNQLGIPRRFVMLAPQRIFGIPQYNIVQLTQFQREGAGTASTVGTLKKVLMDNGDELVWAYDDTLIGKGSGGTDAIIIQMPEVSRPQGSPYNTNEFAKLSPGLEACLIMLCDMAAPREIPTPIPGGAVDVLTEMRITPGYVLRPEATTVVSALFE